ncbi:iron complex outermembrane receptor protein [Sphingomonas kyeonggiensis]|uniref:TonB-dependent siderophore receptor n=1 Tax=Sphingomonas kyeonggiensis TaxID=1268553 RepID=UPI00278B4A7B|nr:TonB-dependent siderophore receptor [Sphingomonas kyeonggiensis]MDQ0251885.1 iron complex outermembrane receptor protein [Sphingomonas kyeonggiensis]
MAGSFRRSLFRGFLMHSALVPALALLPAPAHAEDGPEDDKAQDSTILVTGLREKQTGSGTKTDTPLMETPQTITVIDNDELVRRNALSINQALGYVAGVAANQRGGMVTRYDQLILRGFAPGVYLDGMRLLAGPYSTPQIDFNRIDHIDVVKGPASVLYGNSTPGGLVNLTSKMPEKTASGRFELQLGNYDTIRAVADVNQPLDGDGRWLARIVGGWQKGDGLTRGTFSERYHVSPMLTFAPDDATSLTLIASYQRSPSGGGYSGVSAYGSVLPNPNGKLPRDINTGDPGYERYDHRAKSIEALFRHDFNAHLSFRSSARFQNNWLSYRQLYVAGFATTGTGVNRNTDYSTIIRGGGGADENFDTLTLDNSFNAKFETGPLRHNVLAGIDYQHIAGENFQQFNTGVTANPVTSIPNLNLFNPVYGGTLPSFDLTQLSGAYTNSYSKRDQVGVYLQDQIAIGRLQLIASGRYDWYDQTTLNKRNNAMTPFSQTAFTGRLGALYELPFGVSPYISYSESFEPQTGTTWDGVPFDPVTGRQYEAGIKYQPRGTNALFTVSAYDLRRQKVPVGDPRAGTNGIPSTAQIQIGEVRVRGLEFEGRGEVTPGFDVVAAAAYTDAIITQGAPAVAPTATNSGTPTTTGTRQLGTPEWTASTFLSYDFGKSGRIAGPLSGLKAGLGVRYVGGSDGTTAYKVVSNVTTFERFTTESFTLVDAMLGYDLGKATPALRGSSLALNASNLFDKSYISACPFSNSCYYGAGRTVIGSLRFQW